MKTLLSILISFIIIDIFSQEVFISEKAAKQWATTEGLETPESVLYDPTSNVCYVSNMADYSGKQGNDGFLSKISIDGKILDLKWVTSLKDPKGMGIVGEKLYVADVDNVAEVDIVKSKIIKTYNVTNAKFLNDIATSADGKIFVSDSKDQAIYLLQNGKIELWMQSVKISGVNGLLVEGDKLLAGLSDRITSIDLNSKSISDFILNTGGIDGVVPEGKGNYLISDWMGNVYMVHSSKEKEKLLDTAPAKINAADIDFIIDKRLLLVPTFNDNRVMCYKILK